MSEALKVGMTSTRRIDVEIGRSISFMGDDCRVYATPSMVEDFEMICRDLIKEHVGAGEDSVGTRVEVDHLAATPLGMWVDITVTVVKIEGPRVTCEAIMRDAVEQVGRGSHTRFVVDGKRTADRLRAKRAKAASLTSDAVAVPALPAARG